MRNGNPAFQTYPPPQEISRHLPCSPSRPWSSRTAASSNGMILTVPSRCSASSTAESGHSPKLNLPLRSSWELCACLPVLMKSHCSQQKRSGSSKSICCALLAKRQDIVSTSPCPTSKSSRHCGNANKRKAFHFAMSRFRPWCTPQMAGRSRLFRGLRVLESPRHSLHSKLLTAQQGIAYLALHHQAQRQPSCKKAPVLARRPFMRCLWD
ncbi:hypothetical protein FQZ97_836370 [compost metagenome]